VRTRKNKETRGSRMGKVGVCKKIQSVTIKNNGKKEDIIYLRKEIWCYV